MIILVWIYRYSLICLIACALLCLYQGVYDQLTNIKIKAWPQKQEAETMRRNSLSKEEREAERVEAFRESDFETLAGVHDIKIWESGKYNEDGKETGSFKIFKDCSDIKAAGNSCRFTCRGERYEFFYCEYEVSLPGGVVASPLLPNKHFDDLFKKAIKQPIVTSVTTF